MTASDLPTRQRLFADRVLRQAEDHPDYLTCWQQWRDHLLSIDGIDVVPPLQRDETLQLLIGHARTVNGANAELHPGQPSNCHENVARLAARGTTHTGTPVGQAWTGYALSDDGLWRQHSWATTTDGAVIETTEPRTIYAGVCVWNRDDTNAETRNP